MASNWKEGERELMNEGKKERQEGKKERWNEGECRREEIIQGIKEQMKEQAKK